MTVAYQNNDIILKYMSEAFKDITLNFFGINTPKIKAVVPTELPLLEVAEETMDFVFLLEDETYLHLEFQTTNRTDDLTRFMLYDARLYKKDCRKIRTAIIFSGNINQAVNELDAGSINYKIMTVFMNRYDGDQILTELRVKIKQNEKLNELDRINLIFLPLMKTSLNKNDVAIEAIELAQEIKDDQQRLLCIGAIVGISDKFIDREYINKLKEVLKLTRVGLELRQEGREEGREEGEKQKTLEVAMNLLALGVDMAIIIKSTGLSEAEIKELKH